MNYFSGHHFSMAGTFEQYLRVIRHVPVYYGIQYNHGGGVYVQVGDHPRSEAQGPCVFVTHPGQRFEYGPLNGCPRDHHFICFHGPRVRQYLDSGLLPLRDADPILRINYPEVFHAAVTELIGMINGSATHPDRMTLKLEDVLLQLHEQDFGPKNLPAYQLPFFTELLKGIRNRPQLDWDFNREADRLNITPTHFRRLFRQCCDMSPQQYLIHQRLHLAARLLTSSSEQVGRIAEAVGIGNEFYFSRLFRKKYHLSPLQYRREFVGH